MIMLIIIIVPAPVLENDSHKILCDFKIKKTRPHNNQQKKKRIWKIVNFAVPADHRINLKEIEKKDKCLDLARELKKLWNMKVTIVPIVIGALGPITKWLLKGLEDLEGGGRVETIQTTALLRTARSWDESWRLEKTFCHSNSSEKPSADSDVKNSKGVTNNNSSNNENMLGWLSVFFFVFVFYSVSTFFGSFNAEMNFKQISWA